MCKLRSSKQRAASPVKRTLHSGCLENINVFTDTIETINTDETLYNARSGKRYNAKYLIETKAVYQIVEYFFMASLCLISASRGPLSKEFNVGLEK